MKKILFTTLIISLGLFGAGRGINRASFTTFDINHDGKITKSEFTQVRKARMKQRAASGRYMRNANNRPSFGMFDTNGDGIITKAEFNAFRAKRMGRMRTFNQN